MILLKEQKMIFLKTTKVGGTSFEIALSRYASEDCIITPIANYDEPTRSKLGFRGPQHYKFKFTELYALPPKLIAESLLRFRLPNKYYNHIKADIAKRRLGEKIWQDCLKVSIVRNPFDQAISRYFFSITTESERAQTSFEQFTCSKPSRVTANQSIYQIDGKSCLDFTIRYDKLQEDIEALERKLPSLKGLFETFQGIKAKGNFRDKSESIEDIYRKSPKSFEIINRLCRDEIETYGFKVPNI